MAATPQTLLSSACINLTARRSKPLLHSSVSPPGVLSVTLDSLHLTTPQKPPRFPVCHVQLDGSVGEEHDGIDDPFFDDLVEDESDEDETESSVDLLIRFLQSMLKKVSKRAKKASRSILPAAISPQLVSFAVDGILLLASLSIVKAFLEVACTLGGTVFVVILLVRVIWAAIAFFQSSGNGFNHGRSSFGAAQPLT